ncbi:MAG: hypothetical protein WC130_03740 [Kiritimatiellia bacterium]
MSNQTSQMFFAWIVPPPGWKPGDRLFPQSTTLYYAGTHWMTSLMAGRKMMAPPCLGREPRRVCDAAAFVRIKESVLNELMEKDALLWADTMDHLGESAKRQYADGMVADHWDKLLDKGEVILIKTQARPQTGSIGPLSWGR